MDHFSISDLSRFTGVKPFTIRIWEKRYNALNPDRTEGNTRCYNNKQLRRLLNIVSLLESDQKVSQLCTLTDSALHRMIEDRKLRSGDNLEGFFQSQLIASGFTYDESHFSNVFAQCLVRFGMRDTYTKVLYPMLERIGLLWSAGRVNASNEHFITNLMRQKILTATDLLASPVPAADSWMLFLPEDEFHEAGLLVAHYLIRLSGKKSVYLGANLPLEAVASAATLIKPDNILLFLVHRDTAEETKQYFTDLTASIKGAKIYVAGDRLARQVAPPRRVYYLETVEALDRILGPAQKIK